MLLGPKEVEIISAIPSSEWETGKCFLPRGAAVVNRAPGLLTPSVVGRFKPVTAAEGAAVLVVVPKKEQLAPRYNVDAPGALVMPRPPAHHQRVHNQERLPVIDVVVDPYIAQHLRPHQRDGVTFLYKCVNGFEESSKCGAILADEMGLGKTLQCISLIWTLLQQGTTMTPSTPGTIGE